MLGRSPRRQTQRRGKLREGLSQRGTEGGAETRREQGTERDRHTRATVEKVWRSRLKTRGDGKERLLRLEWGQAGTQGWTAGWEVLLGWSTPKIMGRHGGEGVALRPNPAWRHIPGEVAHPHSLCGGLLCLG